MQIDFIKCHGSGNDFIMVDTTAKPSDYDAVDWSSFARIACDRHSGIGSDGVLLVVRHDDGIYGMDMLNPDGTHAEMCGNGIRCVGRLAQERGYLHDGILRSGGRDYRVATAEDIGEGVQSFAADIPIRTWSDDFAFFGKEERFVGRVIEELSSDVEFTALNLGNPHIVARVDRIDMALLTRLGERVKELRNVLPHGVNVSLYECRSRRELFVATFERGAGITLSCGTAMTASCTAATLLGLVDEGERIEVCNRGGKVYCSTRLDNNTIVTRLEGNATFEWYGSAEFDGVALKWRTVRTTNEEEMWQRLRGSL